MTRMKYDKLWIVYYLSSIRDKSIAWASTNFTPNLEIDISGSSDIEIHKMNSVIVDGKLIGKWQDERPLSECGIVLFEKNKKIFMKRSFGDGSSGDDEFTKKMYRGKIRYQSIQDTHHEYYLIENNGNLGMYGKNGKISEAIIK